MDTVVAAALHEHVFDYACAMHAPHVVRRAHELAASGLDQSTIARELGIGQTTVSRWLRQGLAATIDTPMRRRATSDCPCDCPLVACVPANSYAYLLGQYLGDGTILLTRGGVYRLVISCCASYPGIVEECVAAMQAVLPDNRVGRRARAGAIDVNCYSKHMPCLFPQHGPGKKHERPIVLAPWQAAVALDARPDLFLRGLVHSDGSRFLNRVRNAAGQRYTYVRYQFSNRSDDIRGLFTSACDRLGIEWRSMGPYDISVARADSVRTLDTIVGPKA